MAPHLDCQDLGTALDSISVALERTPDEVADVIRRAGDEWADARAFGERLLDDLGSTGDADIHFSGTYFFHGTRCIDPDRFWQEGILPHSLTRDRVWHDLYRLVEQDVTRSRWLALRDRLRTADTPMEGPFGQLVRDVLLDPSAANSVDYLKSPEIVEDIARGAQHFLSIDDLLGRFAAVSVPCLVKFRVPGCKRGAVDTALIYAKMMLTKGRISGDAACWTFDGRGTAIPPADVMDVEIVATD